ncbi:MAG: hypothetical protein ISP37_06355 [Planktomarina sp.]|uniref:transferrin-binding protein-like solute binding protein n=1 Tax=Planktomarina sp. TaxID=2024851 RepID=UPI003260C525|nr:hypothetical protein [Planktomarina sp.]
MPHTPQTVSVNAQDSDTASKPNWAQALPLRLSQTSSRDGSSLVRYQNIANIEYIYNTSTSTFDHIDLSIDGQVVRFTVNSANSNEYNGSQNGVLYTVDILHPANTVDALSNLEDVAELLFLPTYDATNSTNTNSFAVVGFETPTARVAAATGTATYNGTGWLGYSSASGFTSSELDVTLNVNFQDPSGNQTVGGTIDVSDPANHALYGYATLTIPTTQLTGNGFSATPVLTSSNGLSLSDASINGTFYGDYYGALGGVIHAQGDDSGTTVVVNGGYLAVR